MAGYCIVPIGAVPVGNRLNANFTTTCIEWSELPDKADREVVKVQYGSVLHRYSAAEAELEALKISHLRPR